MPAPLLKYNFISIEGNIGAGKTTLAKRLSEDFNARLILERFEDNSFLPEFYKQPDKYAFPLEMSFLAERYQQLKGIPDMPELISSLSISDYFIDKSLIFAKTNLKPDEFELYSRLFEIITNHLPRPELLVYLYIEKKYSGRQVQLAHIQMSKNKKKWPTINLPKQRGDISISDVMNASPGEDRDSMIRKWCITVWQAFSDSHEIVAALIKTELILTSKVNSKSAS